VVTKRKIYLALDQGPQCAVSLVREYGISPSKTFVILRKWQQNHWVSVCDPPAGHELAESNKAWYCLTMLGMKQLPTNIGLDPETNSP